MCVIQVEAEHPGFSYDLIKGFLRKGEVINNVDMTECFLTMEGMNTSRGNRVFYHFGFTE